MASYTFGVKPLKNAIAGTILFMFFFGGLIALFVSLFSDDAATSKIASWAVAILLLTLGFLLLSLKQKYDINAGIIVKTTFLLGKRCSVKEFAGTNVFLRERWAPPTTGGNNGGSENRYMYEFYVVTKDFTVPRGLKCSEQMIQIFIGNFERAFFSISQNFILIVAKQFESPEIFCKKRHFFSYFQDGAAEANDEIWQEPSSCWRDSEWATSEDKHSIVFPKKRI